MHLFLSLLFSLHERQKKINIKKMENGLKGGFTGSEEQAVPAAEIKTVKLRMCFKMFTDLIAGAVV